MTFAEVVQEIGGVMVVKPGGAENQIRHVVASDLMSDVLIVDEDDMLLVSSLASDQVLRTAQIVGAAGVIIMNGKPLPSSMSNVAKDLGLPLATCRLPKYDGCVAVYRALQKGKPAAD